MKHEKVVFTLLSMCEERLRTPYNFQEHIPYVGKFLRGKIWQMAGHSPKFSLPIFINTTKYLNRIIITMADMLKYFKPKQHHEDNNDEEKPKGHEYYQPL